ncbi:MAG: AMP-binding protein [Clostridia bacterium]|nr:AMP-binding protein [Clostridia bacterium]
MDKIKSLYGLIERGRDEFGFKPLYKFNSNKETHSISYHDFFEYTTKIALALESLGARGKRVMIVGETSVMWLASFIATVSIDGVAVPLDPYLLEDEMIKFALRAKVSYIVCSETYSEVFKKHDSELDGVEQVIVTNTKSFTLTPDHGEVNEKYINFNSLLALGDSLYLSGKTIDQSLHDTKKLAVLLFTSGTTGSSKGVMLCEDNICAVINGAVQLIDGITADDVLLSVLPVFHTYELTCGLLAPQYFGCTICISDGIKYVSRNMKQFSPTVMFMVPLFAEHLYKGIMKTAKDSGRLKKLQNALKLSKGLEKAKIDVRRKLFKSVIDGLGGKLRHIVVGGAAMNPELSENIRALGIGVSQGYGITECSPLISVIPLDDYNPASCGRLMPEMQIFIDKEKASDDFGEIVVKGPNVMLGYYEDGEQTREVLNNGWFRTGDYGYIDNKGYLYITGRKKNVIVLSGGKNVFPEEIEEYLAPCPLIEECVVAGMTDDKTGEYVVGVYVYPSASECKERGLNSRDDVCKAMTDEIKQINKKLVGFKRISKIIIRDEPFEKTSTKKVKRHLV